MVTDLERLLGDRKADMVITDPPYNVDYSGKTKDALKIQNDKSDVVLDTFLGSGTTLIACEKAGRVCYGLELDPRYVDVIVERWEKFTGQKSELLNPT